MDNKITMDRRKFLERFAKLSTATIMVGICVACPGPSEDYNNENSLSSILTINTVKVIDIDAQTQNILSVVSINLSTIYIEFNNSSILLDNPNFIKITDEYTETLISFTQEKIDDTTLKLTLDDNQLNYGTQYSIVIDNGENLTFNFETTSIPLSKETLSLALDTEEKIIVEGLYVNHEMVSDFKILSVENINSDYGDGQNAEVIATIENEIITIKGTKQGKVMLEVVVADKVDEDGESSFYKAYLFVEVV